MAGVIVTRGLGFVTASYTSTAANIALNLGFVPAHIEAVDVTSGQNWWWWNNAMSAASTPSGSAAVFGVVSTAQGPWSTISAGTGGIVALDGSAGTGIGVTIGTNTIINDAGNHAYLVTAWEPL